MKSHRGRKDQVFLRDPAILKRFEYLLAREPGPYLDVGCGDGALLKRVGLPRAGVEQDRTFEKDLADEVVWWENYLETTRSYDARTVVGNLPFARCISYILKTYDSCPNLECAYFIIQEEVARRILSPSRLGILLRHAFHVEEVLLIAGTSFRPQVRVNGILLRLTKRPSSIQELRTIESRLKQIKNPRKKLLHTYNSLPLELQHLRIDQLSIVQEDVLKNYFLS